jgi:hypothetical protein
MPTKIRNTQTAKQAGQRPSPVASPAPPPAWIYHRGPRPSPDAQTPSHSHAPRPPVTLTLVSYRAAHPLSRSSPLRLRPPSRLSSISSISGLRSRPLHLRSGASVDVSSSSLSVSDSRTRTVTLDLAISVLVLRLVVCSTPPSSPSPLLLSSTPPDLSDASDVNRGSGSARLR